MLKIVLFALIFFQGIVNASSGFYINASYSQSNRNIEYVPQSIDSITTTVGGTSFTLTPPNGTKNFTDQQNGFEISTGYKFHKYGVPFFFSPQIDFFRTQNESGLTTLSAIGKLGFEFNNPYTPFSIYGFGGVSGVRNASSDKKNVPLPTIATGAGGTLSVSNRFNDDILGVKYGIGTEVSISKHIAVFAELFQMDLMTRSIPILLSKTTNTSQVLNIAQSINLQGFKVGVTMYFNDIGSEESYF